ncbi:MAG: hypothetical protein AAFV29_17270, partial [Myxococcota bacterium]
ELVAPTYAKLRTLDANEAYTRLANGLRDAALLFDIQHATWRALHEAKPDWSEALLLTSLGKKAKKTKRYRGPTISRKDEGDWVAVSTRLDLACGYASGEAYDLLESPGGQELLEAGYARLGKHLAKELLR